MSNVRDFLGKVCRKEDEGFNLVPIIAIDEQNIVCLVFYSQTMKWCHNTFLYSIKDLMISIDQTMPKIKAWADFKDVETQTESKKFKIGQVWEDRSGKMWFVNHWYTSGQGFPLEMRNLVNDQLYYFTGDGRCFDDTVSHSDLIKLVKDVSDQEPQTQSLDPSDGTIAERTCSVWNLPTGIWIGRLKNHSENVDKKLDEKQVNLDKAWEITKQICGDL